MTALNIDYFFSTPFAAIAYENAADLNPRLRTRILDMEAQGDRHRDTTVRDSQGGPLFESHFDLFKLEDPEFQEVAHFCHRALSSLLLQVSNIDRTTFQRLSFHYDAWFHVSRKHAFQGTHNHQNASWSGIYCVDPGDTSPEHPLSGVVRFHDPRANIFMYADAGNEHLKDTIKHTCFDLTHKAGQLTLFPSYLLHEIFPYFGERPRIVVAFNCSIRPT
ncbi:MAG: putative 2OG-Fe(II) oxygenase [Pseudomonadota bacterium]